MKIPHDPVALEEHFKDDDEGPVSNQGYMPYLNTFILDKVSSPFHQLLRRHPPSVVTGVCHYNKSKKSSDAVATDVIKVSHLRLSPLYSDTPQSLATYQKL